MEMEAHMGGNICIDRLKITPEILMLIAKIDEYKGAWAAIGRISPDRLTALRRAWYLVRFDLSSNRALSCELGTAWPGDRYFG